MLFFMYMSCVFPLNRIRHFLQTHDNAWRHVLIPLSFNNVFIYFIPCFHSNLVIQLRIGSQLRFREIKCLHSSMVKLLVTGRDRTHINFLAANIITLSLYLIGFSQIHTQAQAIVSSFSPFIPISIIKISVPPMYIFILLFLHSVNP